MLALFVATLSLVLLLQRQWITHERLAFPLAQVPLELVREEGGRGLLPRTWVFWTGFLLSLGLISLSRLSTFFPAVPSIPLEGVTLIAWQRVGPLAGLGAWELWLLPWMVAVAYLIPKELSFSCWFFWVVRIALTVAAIAAGATPNRPEEWWTSTFPAPTYQGGRCNASGGGVDAVGGTAAPGAGASIGLQLSGESPGRARAAVVPVGHARLRAVVWLPRVFLLGCGG